MNLGGGHKSVHNSGIQRKVTKTSTCLYTYMINTNAWHVSLWFFICGNHKIIKNITE